MQITEDMKRRYETADEATLLALLPVLWHEHARMTETLRKFRELSAMSDADDEKHRAEMRHQLAELHTLAQVRPSTEMDAAIAQLQQLVLSGPNDDIEESGRALVMRWLRYELQMRDLEQIAMERLRAAGWLPEE